MPSTYAHYRMGQEVRKSVGQKEREVIEKYPQLYLIGLHGPDILFYYHALSKNEVNTLGFEMHEQSGEEVFKKAAAMIKNAKNHDAALAYIYGFICHFALDVTCHGYIGKKIAESGVSHAEIEVEFDRRLLILDGEDPIRKRLTSHIVPSTENASVIQAFFPEISVEQVKKALKDMIRYNNILVAPSKLKRGIIHVLLRLSGHYESMHGLMVNYHENPVCTDSTERLINLYQQARELAVELIGEYGEYLSEQSPLHSVYRYTFESTQSSREGDGTSL